MQNEAPTSNAGGRFGESKGAGRTSRAHWRSDGFVIGLDCCKAIEGLGNACFREVFRYGPYSLLYGKAVKGYCSWIESPPSPPVYLPQSTPSV
ncbi:hypothetical protein Acr_26g0013850 [Actinidia rufa]|uniref:Prolamin-like domain-containing protein n=1 Tax=Actinidia rufa TaxID=165716 RepID=A0A7J0H4T8_9ERIC|nr:hypothetical protein Acr_26g0013850 [Actinidia rufa]